MTSRPVARQRGSGSTLDCDRLPETPWSDANNPGMPVDGRQDGAPRGRLKPDVLDCSGTTAYPYVLARPIVFVEVLTKEGVEISMARTREPMKRVRDRSRFPEIPAS